MNQRNDARESRALHFFVVSLPRFVLGALIFAFVYSLGLRLQIMSGFEGIPQELMLALPYLAVIAALALSGRNAPYPGAYLKPYRRS
mgnify:CR=1 FL=1